MVSENSERYNRILSLMFSAGFCFCRAMVLLFGFACRFADLL